MSLPLRSSVPRPAPAFVRDPSAGSGAAMRVARRVWRPALATAGVVAFWYGTTGALLALERSAETRAAAFGVSVVAALGGLACTRAARRGAGAAAGASAVLGGALLWTSVAAAFYGGWVVGPAAGRGATGTVAGLAPTVARAVAALGATAYSTVLAAALLTLCVFVARGRPERGHASRFAAHRNRAAALAPLTFATLWAAHELAKLNVFLGVASPGVAYLPPYLAHLRAFFGPAHNSPLLGWSVASLAIAAAATGQRARAAGTDAARRTGLALIAGILVLAALEHAFLGVSTPPRWWDAFLAWREAASTAAVGGPG